MRLTRRTWMGALIAVSALGACDGAEAQHGGHAHGGSGGSSRCANCGMSVEANSPWRAGLTLDGQARIYDSPKCMFSQLRTTATRATEVWVSEYYSHAARPASSMSYVLGSDVLGPMGADVVPIEDRSRAERFLADHHGNRILAFDEVTREIAEGLFRHM
jgi:copper chaperone NosL